MDVKSKQFTIQKLYDLKARIDPKPQYQRTPVWKVDRKRLLVDSIFRGYDLPKFYLSSLEGNSFYDYEVCDGQQRLRTIWEFFENKFALGKGAIFKGKSIAGKKYSDLGITEKDYFTNFNLTIALITKAAHNEIRDLFARLQKGMGLNQAELRRALSTHIGTYVESIVDNHKFFKNCGFPDLRYKHQDYIDHVIAYMVNEFLYDFKGQSLKDVYVNVSPLQATELIKDVALVLDEMEKINSYAIGIFRNKWAFVDSYILIYQFIKKGKKISYKDYVLAFNVFEKSRKENSKTPNSLIEKKTPTPNEKSLYDYITSFTKDGNLKTNIKKRNEVFIYQFKHLFR